MTQLLQRFNGGQCLLLIVFILGLSGQTLTAQNGPACDTYTNKKTANGLGGNFVQGVYAVGSTVYAATQGGLSISTDGGSSFTNKKNADVFGVYAVGSTVYAAMNGGGLSISTDGGSTFTNKTTANGLGSTIVYGVYAVGSTVYAATQSGLSISTNGGNSFTNKTTANGLGNNYVAGVYAVGSTVYAAAAGGLSISTDGGSTFTNKTTANGLGSNNVKAVYAVGSTVYAATNGGGLSISTDGGSTFTNKTTANGLGNNNVQGVYAVGSTVYAATYGGLSISTDGGSSFTNKTTANGLGSNFVNGVYADGSRVYAATNSGLSFCPPPLTLTASVKPTTVCAGSTVALSVTATGGTAPYSYTWAAPVGSTLSATSTSAVSATVTTSGVKTFTVTVGGGEDAPVSTTVSVAVNPPVLATLSPSSSTITCTQTSVTLTAGGGGTYRFSAGATQLNGGNMARVNTAGVYSVTVTSANGCSAVAQTTVMGDQRVPTASLTNDGPLTLYQTSVTLTATPVGQTGETLSYVFSAGATPIGTTNQATVNASGTYSVTVTTTNGCSDVASTSVSSDNTAPVATANNNQTATVGMTFSYTVNAFTDTETPNNLTYSASISPANGFSFDAATRVISGTPTGTGVSSVTVTATDPRSLSAATSFTITVSEPFSTIRYVRVGGSGSGNSWADASGDLQSQINVTGAQQVWVAAGTYKPTTGTDRTVSFAMKNGVAIYGGFVGSETSLSQRPALNLTTLSSTTLSGDIGATGSIADNSHHVISNPPGLDNTAVLDGFLITGGYSDFGGGMYNNGRGSGNGCSPTVRNCSFQNNSATDGGAMFNSGYGGISSPILTNCSFLNNSSANQGGAIYNFGYGGTSSPVLTNCSFQNNSATFGGAIYNNGYGGTSSPLLTNCSFQNNSATNQGGAIYNYGSGSGTSSPVLTNCSFLNNSTTNQGGAMFNNGYDGTSSPVLTNCSFQNNSTTNLGGAIYNNGGRGTSSPLLTNCSFQNNSAVSGGAMVNDGVSGTSTPVLTNCVVWNNGGNNTFYNYTSPYLVYASSITTSYSLFESSVTGYNDGPGNLTTTILPFASTTSAELGAGSPAIDAGDPATGMALVGTTDLGGNPRFVGGRIDMGAYEFQGSNNTLTVVTSASPNPVCAGSTVALSVTASGSTAPYGYSWAAPAGITLSATSTSAISASVGAEVSGVQTLTVTVAASGGSPGSTSLVSLTVNAPPTPTLEASSSATLTCAQTQVALFAGGGNRYVFAGPGIVSQEGSQALVNVAGVYSVTATNTATGCFSTTSITIDQDNTVPPASLASSGPLSCAVTSVTLTASPNGQRYQFSAGATPIGTSNQATVSTPGLYSVTVINGGNGCTGVASVSVSQDNTVPVATLSASPSTTLTCTQTQIALFAGGGDRYVFSGPGIVSQEGSQALVNVVGGYSVTVTNGATGCFGTTSITISQDAALPQVRITADPSLTITQGQTATLTASVSGGTAPFTYTWSTGANSNAIVANTGGTYSMTATGANGCTATASATLTVTPVVSGPFAITAVTTVSCNPILPNRFSVSFAPRYQGLDGTAVSFAVANELLPTTNPGPYTLQLYTDNPRITLNAVQSGVSSRFVYDWLVACNSATTPNTPPRVAMGISGQTATQGTYFSYVIPDGTFTDTETPGSLKLSAAGLPGGLSFSGATLSGTPSTTVGSPFSITITATDPGGLTASTVLMLSVQPATGTPPPTAPFAITGVTTLSCTPVADRISIVFTPRYAGMSGASIAFGVVNELAPTTDPAPYSLTLYRDNPVITLQATQTGNGGPVGFSYDWLAACLGLVQANTPPRLNQPVPPQSATVGVAYTLNLVNTFTDQETPNQVTLTSSLLPAGLTLNGQQISGTPSVSGVSSVTLTATDGGGLSSSTAFSITVNPASSTPTPPPTAAFSITGVTTVSCEVISAGQRRVRFRPRYAGENGTPISFSVVNELAPTTSVGPYSLSLYTDNPTITLSAVQSGVSSQFSYGWLAVCNASARQAAVEVPLRVRVLGNPAVGSQLTVEVRGAEGQPLHLQLANAGGGLVNEHRVEKAGTVERQTLELGRQPGGILLLRVSTPTQSHVVKVVKGE